MISVNYLGFDTAVNMNKEFNAIVLILDDGQEESPKPAGCALMPLLVPSRLDDASWEPTAGSGG